MHWVAVRCIAAVAGVVLTALAVSSAPAVGAQSSQAPAAKGSSLLLPSLVEPGASLRARGRVNVRKWSRRLRVSLERKRGSKWARVASGRLSRKRSFAVPWSAPQRAGSVTLRVVVMRGRRRVAISRARRLVVRAPAGRLPSAPFPGPGPGGPGGPPAGPGPGGPPGPTIPAPPRPLAVAASAVNLPPGSVVPVDLPAPVTTITTVDPLAPGSAQGLSVAMTDGRLTVAATASITLGNQTLAIR